MNGAPAATLFRSLKATGKIGGLAGTAGPFYELLPIRRRLSLYRNSLSRTVTSSMAPGPRAGSLEGKQSTGEGNMRPFPLPGTCPQAERAFPGLRLRAWSLRPRAGSEAGKSASARGKDKMGYGLSVMGGRSQESARDRPGREALAGCGEETAEGG